MYGRDVQLGVTHSEALEFSDEAIGLFLPLLSVLGYRRQIHGWRHKGKEMMTAIK
jgi:hypothetical protein